MPSYFDSYQGFLVRFPSWHKLEQKILADWPGTWELARAEAGLLWEPVTEPVYTRIPERTHVGDGVTERPVVHLDQAESYLPITGYHQVKRNDTGALLSIQTSIYRVINNTDFGAVIETVLGTDMGQQLQYEGVFTLMGGRMVIAVIRLGDGLSVPGDPSPTLQYAVFCSRHDGNGGLKVIITNIRVVCANTWGMAEHAGVDGKTSFTVRHVGSWDERVAAIREQLSQGQLANNDYLEISGQLLAKQVSTANRELFLRRVLPIGDDMGVRQQGNRQAERSKIREILAGPTCEGIDKTAYGLLQATGEWADHFRRFAGYESYTNRTLFTKEPIKIRAFREAKKMAGVK